MKNLTLTIAALFILVHFSNAQVGDSFPEMTGTSLTDEEIKVPSATQDKMTLIGIAFSKKAEDDLQTWFQPVWERFIREADPNALIPEMKPDVNVVFIPMFTGLKRGASGSAIRKMQKDVDKKLHSHVIVYSGKMGDYEDLFKMTEKDQPYFYVVNKEGEIIYATSGRSSIKKLNEVEEMVTDY
ncbi:hypothetical protein [Marivirga sp.]|uniref:hypothetical protein n=1 Tax=Marivirga sp. TaxID=2018662 RepID=UPI0025D70E1D|nr:hypothetical protein [Marivirga sp.]